MSTTDLLLALLPVSLHINYEVLLSSKFQLLTPQNIIEAHADRPIPVICRHDHALMQYAALSVGPLKSP
jgi:hypothetical protein